MSTPKAIEDLLLRRAPEKQKVYCRFWPSKYDEECDPIPFGDPPETSGQDSADEEPDEEGKI